MNNQQICVGLDFDQNLMSEHNITNIVFRTYDLVNYYKLNLSFFLNSDIKFLNFAIKTVKNLNRKIILDAKFNDIPSSAKNYAEYVFGKLELDGVTVNPYLGVDSIEPFMEYEYNQIPFFLLKTSNNGSANFQNSYTITKDKLYHNVFDKIMNLKLKKYPNKRIGFVYGVNKNEKLDLDFISQYKGLKNVYFLIPGIGYQGGNIEKNIPYNIIYSMSRSIINDLNPRQALIDLLPKTSSKIESETEPIFEIGGNLDLENY